MAFSPACLRRILAALLAAPFVCFAEEQCGGGAPMKSVSTFLGADLDYSVADRICCNNHRWAERRGYLNEPQVDLFSRLDPKAETVFYDSVCGIPLFVAPRGRSFDDFYEESLHHGWPSFRPEEMVSENVIIHEYGRMESKCGTHLGHNLPQGGVDRYCIDLVCIAGTPLDTTPIPLDESALTTEKFNATLYVSSAKENSGNDSQAKSRLITIIVGSLVGAGMVFMFAFVWYRKSAAKAEKVDSQQVEDDEKGDDWSRDLTEEDSS
uniref:Peptide-methionine (R)-S-oxide reductase n=1 Tax=Odontella aurita TaxID=265563 RepID=A0A7S4NEN2_9STRA|mmetsp:Transcript_61874/g.182736  ORF Transcript_61874/g.182736 Transcript_61874/m.182736 type:complete len:266 (+) Transcript_61874:224-1021(+)